MLSKYPEAKIIIPGHGEIGNTGLLEHTKRLAESTSKASAGFDVTERPQHQTNIPRGASFATDPAYIAQPFLPDSLVLH